MPVHDNAPSHLVESDSSDSSYSSDSSGMNVWVGTSAIRLSVCLERYYTDHRARCYVRVPQNQPVLWLHMRLEKLFLIPNNYYLSKNGHVLLPWEPLALLSQDDVIDVIPYYEEEEQTP